MIYPINEALEKLMESFVDDETGELKQTWTNPDNGAEYVLTEGLMNELVSMLQLDFDDKVVEIRNDYVNANAEAEAIRAEIKKLYKRLKPVENRAERDKRFMAYLLKGEKFQKDAVKIGWRKSEEVKFDGDNPKRFVAWADKNFPSLLKYSDPEPSRTEIKKAIKAGLPVDYAHIETKNNIQIS